MPANFTPFHIPRTDTVQTVTLKQDEFSDVARMRAIAIAYETIRTDKRYTLDWLTNPDAPFSWSTEGTRLHKRISNAVFKSCGARMPEPVMTRIAELAAQEREKNLHFDIVDKFDWEKGDYGDHRSCYWGGYSSSRLVLLPKLGACALRQYNKDADGTLRGIGRCWLLPYPYATEGDEIFVAYNFYGSLQNGDNVETMVLSVLNANGSDEWIARRLRPRMEIAEMYINDENDRVVFSKKSVSERTALRGISLTTHQIMGSTLPFPAWTNEGSN